MIVKLDGKIVPTSKGSISISTAIDERSTCSFTVVDVEGTEHYVRGTNVEILGGNEEVIFSGIVEKSKEVRIAGVGLFHEVDCVDWHYLADKRIVAKRYENMLTGDIVKDLVDNYLSFEGVSYSEENTYKGHSTPLFHQSLSDTIKVVNATTVELMNEGDKVVTEAMTNDFSPAPNTVYTNTGSNRTYRMFDGITGRDEYVHLERDGRFEVTYDFGEGNGKAIDRYGIQGANLWNYDVRSPRTWELHGYNPATDTWELLDRQEDMSWYQNEYKEFPLKNTTIEYQRYRIRFSRRNGDTDYQVAIDEIYLYAPKIMQHMSGQIVSFPVTVSYTGLNNGTVFTWTEDIPQGTSATVETSIDDGETWMLASNGHRVPNLYGGEVLSDINLRVRITLSTTSELVTPRVSDLRIQWLDEVGSLQEGVFVEEAVFNYIPVSEAISTLAEKSGYWWDISQTKKLRFAEKSARVSPFEVNKMSIIKDSLTVENGNNKYRNQQYIIGGKDITDVQTESFKGDGAQQTFAVGYKIALVPTIYVDNVKVPRVGIRGLEDTSDTDIQWFWSKGDNTITQNKDSEPLSSDQTIRIEYQGEFDVVVVSKDVDEIAYAKELEGGTGIVEAVDEDKGATSRESAFSSASKKLERYSKAGRKIDFKTWKRGLEAGQLVTVDFPIHNINKSQYLIESVEISYENEQEEYRVTATHNLAEGSWAKFFYDMAVKGRTYVIRENIGDDEVLTILETFNKTWLSSEDPNIYKILFPSANTYAVGAFPSFEESDRVKYMSFFSGSTEIFRKQITKQTVSPDGSNIISTININPSEANDIDITHVGWFGGIDATDVVGTGVLLDKQPFEFSKNSGTSLQIDKIDTKGW